MSLLGGALLEGERGPAAGRIVQRRRLALLALLASSNGRPVSRDKLIACLWPESGAAQARHSLSDSLHVIHKAVGGRAILAEGDELRLDPGVVACDVWRFEAALGAGDLEGAVGLYKGPFLDGFFIGGDALEFESWATSERERLARSYLAALERLAESAAVGEDPRQAAAWWRRLCAEEPDNSRAVLGLMAALAAIGDRAGALRQAVEHAEHLKSEYGAEPDPTVAAFVRRLQEDPAAWVPPARTPGNGGTAVEADSAGERPKPGLSRQSFARRRVLFGSAVAAVAVLAVLYIARRGAGPDPTPQDALAVQAVPGIAVLPFTVNDPALETWREGMVDLLSTNLDGMGGLRAIDSRTVLARWREIIPEAREPDLATTLEVARRTGARYAVLGSVIAIGPDIRLVAEIHDLEGARELGQGQVAGAPDSVFALIDRLSIDVVRAILQRGGEDLTAIPRLAGLTTRSLPALKAFLEGESFYRRSDFAHAIGAYESAVSMDSTFALALFRLSSAYGWVENIDSDVSRTYLERAARLAERLSPREATLVRADLALVRGSIEGLEPLRESVQQHPDDPEAWYLLGDTYVHLGDQALVDESEVGRVLGRAVALDPTFAPYRIHLVERAVRQRDEKASVRLASAYGRLAAGTAWDRRNRLAIAFVFGNAAARAHARATIDTVPTRVVWGVAGLYLLHPRFLALQEELLRGAQQRDDAPIGTIATRLFFNHYNRGRYRAALAQLDDPSLPPGFEAFGLYALSMEGVAVSPAGERDALSVAPEDTLSALDGLFTGARAADREQWVEHAEAIRRLRDVAGRHLAAGDSVSARLGAGAARGLEAYGLWRRGRPDEARPLLEAAGREVTGHEPVPRAANHLLRWWLAGVLTDLGRTAEAVQVLETFWEYPLWNHPQAAYRAGELLAGAGRHDEARRAFDYALLAWHDADPELQARIESARRELARLPGPPVRESR
ncbi:MAG: BTAD domain-containing putative transcriptional regulator [Gemmatimonadota bacterium]